MSEQGTRLLDAMAGRVLVMDAAMGTRLVAHGLDLEDEGDGSALWNLKHPDAVAAIHARDVAAGADVLLTNTFLASRTWLEPRGYGNRVAAINRWAGSMAREASGPDRFVVGSIGPTAAADSSGAAYLEQAEALMDAGVDALLFETHLWRQATSALKVLCRRVSIPCFVSLYKWPSTDIKSLVGALESLGARAIGVNCMGGIGSAPIWAERLGAVTRLPLLFKPSGPRWEPGRPDEQPEAFAAAVPALVTCGARLIGGCCGTTEAHVAALRAACYDPLLLLHSAHQPRRL